MSGWKPGFCPENSRRRPRGPLGPALALLGILGCGGNLWAQAQPLPEFSPPAVPRTAPSPAQRLEWAVENNDTAQAARILRDNPGLLTDPLPSGGSPLGNAVARGSWETLDYLLEKGADLRGRDREGNQALLSAYLSNRRALVRKLRDRGAGLQAEDGFGNTALHLLPRFPTGLWGYILSEGFDLEARNYLGQTPFMRAVWEGNLTVADLLAKEGVRTGEMDYLGRTARDYARRMGDEAMELYLDSLP